MFYDIFVSLCREKGIKPTPLAHKLGINAASVSYWKRSGSTPKQEILNKIADYFGVSVDFLLGKTYIRDRNTPENKTITDEDIKFALFHGADDITDEMYEEVKRYARYIKDHRNEDE